MATRASTSSSERKLASSNMAIGVDVGGSSIKCALIDLDTGKFASERFSTPTPAQGTTEELLAALAKVVANIPGDHAVGLAFPSVIRGGTVRTAAKRSFRPRPSESRAEMAPLTSINSAASPTW